MITKLKTGENIGIYTYLYNNYRPIFSDIFFKISRINSFISSANSIIINGVHGISQDF